jgi:uncharacterized protein with PQ loop repeat
MVNLKVLVDKLEQTTYGLRRLWASKGSFSVSKFPVLALVDCLLTIASVVIAVALLYGTAALAEAGIVNKGQLKMTLSLVCPAVTMTQFISPIPVVLDALRKMDVQNLPVPVFQSQSACNILGLSYGIRIQNVVVLANNMFGLGCQIAFLGSYHYVQAGNDQWLGFATKLALLFNVMLYTCTQLISINLLGQITTAVNVILFAAPLAKLGIILKTRNATSLPTAMTVISAISNAVWTLYALLIDDLIVLLPSLLGFMLSFFQVLVLLWCFHILPFDLSFLLLPCRASAAKTGKKVGIEDGLEYGEDASMMGKEMAVIEDLGSSFEARSRMDNYGETGGTRQVKESVF